MAKNIFEISGRRVAKDTFRLSDGLKTRRIVKSIPREELESNINLILLLDEHSTNERPGRLKILRDRVKAIKKEIQKLRQVNLLTAAGVERLSEYIFLNVAESLDTKDLSSIIMDKLYKGQKKKPHLAFDLLIGYLREKGITHFEIREFLLEQKLPQKMNERIVSDDAIRKRLKRLGSIISHPENGSPEAQQISIARQFFSLLGELRQGTLQDKASFLRRVLF